METKINIAEILKDKPKRTKLYTDTFGELSIENIDAEDIDAEDELGIILSSKDDDELLFYNDGRYNLYGEPILVPSKSMHDWRKFAWKKGDVLVSKDNVYITFEEFENDDYTRFKGKHYLWREYDEEDYSKEETKMLTSKFEKVNNNDAQTYINIIEKRLGGKLNGETLEIEKPEFKDGDIVFVKSYMIGINAKSMIAIFRKEKENDKYEFSPSLCETNEHDTYFREDLLVLSPSDITTSRPATDSEKQQLFDALAKKNKAWDAEKKKVVDLKPKVELKPFDKVLIRDFKDQVWHVSLFGYKDANNYYCCNGSCWNQCIPYIGNESLLGTTKDVEG